MLETRNNVTGVVVVIGNDESDIITPDEKEKMWNMFIKSEQTISITVVKSNNLSSLAFLVKELDKNKDVQAYVAVDNKLAKTEEFNYLFEKFKNVEYQLIPSQYKEESEELLNAIESDNKMKIHSLLPTGLNKEQIEEIKSFFVKEPVEDTTVGEKFLNEISQIYKNLL